MMKEVKINKGQHIRTLSKEAQDDLRLRVVKSVLDKITPVDEVASLFDIKERTVYLWLERFKKGGLEGLKTRRADGKERKLTPNQEHRVWQLMRKKTPDFFGFSSSLWTRALVSKLIHKQFSIRLSLPSITRLLKRLDVTFKKPVRKATEQDPIEVKKWKEETLPKIRRDAANVRASIYFGDEAGVNSVHTSGKTWGPRGERVVVRTSARHEKVNVLSAISLQGDFRFVISDGNVNSEVFCNFLERIMKGRRRPVFLIVDNAGYHKTKKVQDFVDSFNGKLRVIYLPPYSPELNPDEFVWSDLKRCGVNPRSQKVTKDLKSIVKGHLRSLQKSRRKISRMCSHAFAA